MWLMICTSSFGMLCSVYLSLQPHWSDDAMWLFKASDCDCLKGGHFVRQSGHWLAQGIPLGWVKWFLCIAITEVNNRFFLTEMKGIDPNMGLCSSHNKMIMILPPPPTTKLSVNSIRLPMHCLRERDGGRELEIIILQIISSLCLSWRFLPHTAPLLHVHASLMTVVIACAQARFPPRGSPN